MSSKESEPPASESEERAGATLEDARALINDGALEELRRHIRENGGDEVFCAGRCHAEPGKVDELQLLARGHARAAPALVERAAEAEVAIHNHPSGDLRPSDADLEVASVLGNAGTAFYIVDNAVERVRVVVPTAPARNEASVTPAQLRSVLGPEGRIARKLEGYEHRPGQERMAQLCGAALSRRRILLCEAGTGTGKTFAYLVPAVLWALANQRKVVISTGTINLQEQIADKDIPFLQDDLLPPFRAVLVKGRRNYVSLRRAEEAAALPDDAFESERERRETLELVAWARDTPSGDLSDLGFTPAPAAWERVESQSDNCLGSRCPRFSDCHYYQTRRAAQRAQILIVNHHLFFADLVAKLEMGGLSLAAVLPPYDRVVFDEAHRLEEVAASCFGLQLSERGLAYRLGRLVSRRRGGRGLLPALTRKLAQLPVKGNDDELRLNAAHAILNEDLRPQILEVGDVFANAFELGRALLEEAPSQERGNEQVLRLGTRMRDGDEQRCEELLLPFEEGSRRLEMLAERAGDLFSLLDGFTPSQLSSVDGLQQELKAAIGRLEGLAEGARRIAERDDPELVRWFEVSGPTHGRAGRFRAVPLELGPLLRDALWQRLEAAVLSSAPLRTARGTDFLRAQLGLDEPLAGRVDDHVTESPFDFATQARLAIPSDHSEPGAPSFVDDTCYAIERLTSLSGGGCFVLFTSYRMLNQVFERLSPVLERLGLTPLKQGDQSRRELLRSFKARPGAVLFGTDSFWEGVDVPGDQLRLVIITKMPFRVPTDPLHEARSARITERGGRPFIELTLPQAILKLRQGFGRLIRSRRDRGVVVLLDRRLLDRFYGRRVLASLPPVTQLVGPLEDDILPAVEAFFARRET
jgi:ATP-dependent DNA helicase DinG